MLFELAKVYCFVKYILIKIISHGYTRIHPNSGEFGYDKISKNLCLIGVNPWLKILPKTIRTYLTMHYPNHNFFWQHNNFYIFSHCRRGREYYVQFSPFFFTSFATLLWRTESAVHPLLRLSPFARRRCIGPSNRRGRNRLMHTIIAKCRIAVVHIEDYNFQYCIVFLIPCCSPAPSIYLLYCSLKNRRFTNSPSFLSESTIYFLTLARTFSIVSVCSR